MRVVVGTIARDRARHLTRQRDALAASHVQPHAHVVVSMDLEPPPEAAGADVVHRPVAGGRPLPLAAARNAVFRRAVEAHGADLVVLLDVDCIPGPGLVGRYAEAAGSSPAASLLAGVVHYLAPGAPQHGPFPSRGEVRAAPPHAARPVPADRAVVDEPRMELFWSLSFAASPATHVEIGGFDEAYEGYGAEDTDYAFRARRADVRLRWVGGAPAYHQHHPVSSPPVEHLADIVRNARRFHARWNRWPMEGWLAAFADRGLVEWAPGSPTLTLTQLGRTGPSRP